ncbi:MAG: hypothetical protein ACK5NF_02190 [Bacilli bacterium]
MLGIQFEDGLVFDSGLEYVVAKSLMTKEEFLALINDESNNVYKEGYEFVGWNTSGFDTEDNAAS